MNHAISGGCACGAVRYELSAEPWDAGWCHCRTCQLTTAAPAAAFATVQTEEHRFTQGEDQVRTFRSSSFGRRRFCGQCGTLLSMEVEHQPETIDFPIATLDAPDRVAPGFHIFFSSRIAWFDTGDHLPRHDRFRPETRGLSGTEPPE